MLSPPPHPRVNCVFKRPSIAKLIHEVNIIVGGDHFNEFNNIFIIYTTQSLDLIDNELLQLGILQENVSLDCIDGKFLIGLHFDSLVNLPNWPAPKTEFKRYLSTIFALEINQ